jgi:glucose/arabinose dehydrogenase
MPVGSGSFHERSPKGCADHANIMRMNRDSTRLEIYARGIRNSVGFEWDPRTGEAEKLATV